MREELENKNIVEMQPEEKFAAVEKFKNTLQENFLNLGELLSNIKQKGTYKVKGYKTFRDFIETEYNISGSFAMKLISVYELYVEDLDVDEFTLNQIGFERLCMIKPLVHDQDPSIAETWIDEAKEKATPELRQVIKDEKEKTKKVKPFKEVFSDQFVEKLCVFFNCPKKSLMFKFAVFFNDYDLNELKQEIKDKQRKLEQSPDFEGLFADMKEGE